MSSARMKEPSSRGDCRSTLMQRIGGPVTVGCYVFVDNVVKCMQFACVRHHGKDTGLEDNFPKDPGLICSAVGKLPDASSNEEKRMDLGIDY